MSTSSASAGHPGRSIVVVVDGARPPAWQAEVVERLGRQTDGGPVGTRCIGEGVGTSWIWRLHHRIEWRVFHMSQDAHAPAEPPAAVGAAMSPPDLLVWLSESEPPVSETLAQPTLVVRHGPRRESMDIAFRRAVLRGERCVRTVAVLIEGGATRVVGEAICGVRPASLTVTLNAAAWTCADLVVRLARRSDLLGEAEILDAAPRPTPRPAAAALSGALLLCSPWRWARAIAVRVLFRRPWRVRVRPRRATALEGSWEAEARLVRWRQGHVYADPCLIEHEGRCHLFFEDVAPGEAHGVISHVEIGGPARSPATVLRRPHHLSYPQVFAHRGRIYMIPESAAARRLELYVAASFPDRWELAAVLCEGVAVVDATVFEEAGRLWMFAGVARHGMTHLELQLFWADEIAGPWTPHPANPVDTDVRSARPAGGVLRWGERLVRPAQDASRRYGGAISFRQVDTLTTTAYADHEIARIDPGDVGARATHTYTAAGGFEAIDVRQRELRARRWRQRLAGRRRGPQMTGPD